MDYPFVLSIAGFIIITCFGIIAYLWKAIRQISFQDFTGLIEATNNLKEASVELRAGMSNIKVNCSEKHIVIDKRLDDHRRTLKNHSIKIATIETKIK